MSHKEVEIDPAWHGPVMLSVSPPRFYSLIPHNFGMKAPPPINTQDALVFVPVPVDVVLGVDAFRTPKTLQ